MIYDLLTPSKFWNKINWQLTIKNHLKLEPINPASACSRKVKVRVKKTSYETSQWVLNNEILNSHFFESIHK